MTMLVRNRVVTLDRIEPGEWSGKQLKRGYRETCTVTAHFSDGTSVAEKATVDYAPNERERLVEQIMRGTANERQQNECVNLLLRRPAAVNRKRGELQKRYGKGIVTRE